MLSAAIKVVRPRVILELGSWLGLSTRWMAELCDPDTRIYTLDWFKNTAIYENALHRVSPIDKLFFEFSRFETFHRNLDDFKHIYMLKGDVYELLEELQRDRLDPDIVFIDCEKKTEPLLNLLRNLHRYFPNAVVVGDDFVFPSVKRALNRHSGPLRVLGAEAYALVPASVRNARAVHAELDTAFRVERARLSIPAGDAELAALVDAHSFDEVLARCPRPIAVKLPYHQGGTVLHKLCRTRHAAILGLWDQLFARAAEDWRKEDAITNVATLTPFDYLAYEVSFE